MLNKTKLVAIITFLMSTTAFAAEGASNESAGLIAIAAAFTMGIAAIGGSLGQGKVASSALEGIARNPAAQPKIFVPMIIGLALIESLVIYAFVIAFQLVGKI